MLTAGGALVLSGTSVANYLMAQPLEPALHPVLSDVGLMAAAPCKESIEMDGKLITVTVCDRSTSTIDWFLGSPCGSPGTGACVFTNQG